MVLFVDPLPVENFRKTEVTDSSITLSWDVPENGTFVGYRLIMDAEEYQNLTPNLTAPEDATNISSVTVQGLESNNLYNFEIVTTSAMGLDSEIVDLMSQFTSELIYIMLCSSYLINFKITYSLQKL